MQAHIQSIIFRFLKRNEQSHEESTHMSENGFAAYQY